MIKFIYSAILIICVTTFLSGCRATQNDSLNSIDPPNSIEESEDDQINDQVNADGYTDTTVEGMVVFGADLGKDFCSEGIYLQTQTHGDLLMMVPAEDAWVQFAEGMLVGSQVRIQGRVPSPDTMFCQALSCICEPQIRFGSGLEKL